MTLNIAAATATDTEAEYEPSEGYVPSEGEGDVPSEGDIEQQQHGLVLAEAVAAAALPGVVTKQTYRSIISTKHEVLSTSPFHHAIVATVAEAQLRRETNCIDALGWEMIGNKSHRTSSLLELGDKVDRNRRKLPTDIVTLAAALLEWQQPQRHQLEANVVSAINDTSDLVMYVDVATSDETPMPVVAKEFGGQELDKLAAALPLDDKAQVPGVICIEPLPSDQLEAAKVTCKLFQSDQYYVMLTRSRDEQGTFYTVIDGEGTDMLQRLASTDANSTQNALTRVCNVSEAADKFQTKVRITCTDDATLNPLCENT